MSEETELTKIQKNSAAGAEDEAFTFVEDPTFEVDYKGDCAYEVKVSIPPANKKKQAQELYGELKGEVEIPGFRRGRAPLKLVERKFAKVVEGEVTGKLVSAAFEKLVEDEDLKPAGMPDLDGLDEDGNEAKDSPLAFTFKFEVAPRIELGKYRGIEVERPVVSIGEKDVEESIEQLRERYAVYDTLKKNGKAKDGDQVVIDFKGTVGGEEFSGGSAENYPYILGSGRFFKEFEEILLGASAEAELTCQVTFPDDYFAEELRGKTADFSIAVHEVKRKKLPAVDDEFAKTVGHDTAEELKTKIQEELKTASLNRSRLIAEARAMDAIIKSSTFEIAKSLIDEVTEQNKSERIQHLLRAGTPPEQLQELLAEIETIAKESALRGIKGTIALNEIGEAEGVEVTEEDFEKEAETLSRSVGASAEAVARFMTQSDQRSGYEDRIFRAKAMNVIMENAAITDKELTQDELNAAEAAIEGEEVTPETSEEA